MSPETKKKPQSKKPAKLSIPEQYIADVLAGKLVVSKQVRDTCERHKLDLAEAHERGWIFRPRYGMHVIRFVERFCKHSQAEWAGTPVKLEPWQQALLYILNGWRAKATGWRRFKFAYIELAKGNGKSLLASALGLYELIASGEPGAEVYCVATKKEQARIVFAEAERMVAQSPALKSRIDNPVDNLNIPGTASKFEPLASEEDSLDGPRPQAIIADELHKWGVSARGLWDVLANALGKRRSGIFIAITTAGSGQTSLCWQQHEYSEKVNLGLFQDDTWFSWICCLEDEDDWEDPANWIKANPNLHVSVKLAELTAAVNKAKGDPASLNGVLRLRLGRWTENASAWMDLTEWDACTTLVDPFKLRGRVCYAGLDLSTTTDISAFVLVFPATKDDHHWYILPFFFLPKDNIEKRVKKDRVPYDVWARQNLFELTPGNIIDYDYIRQKIRDVAEIYKVEEIAFDRYHATQLVTDLSNDGFVMTKFSQGFEGMSAPTKRLMELTLGRKLAHGKNPILRWMATNAVAVPGADGISTRLDKQKSREKIDGIIATIMGIGRASVVVAPAPKNSFKPFFL